MGFHVVDRLQTRSGTILRDAPCFPVAVGVICGIVFEHRLDLGITVYSVIFVAVLTAALIRRRHPLVGPLLVFLGASCLGAMSSVAVARPTRTSDIASFAQFPARIARVRGTVVDAPRVRRIPDYPFRRWSYQSDGSRFLLDTDAIEGRDGDIPVKGRIRVTVSETVLDLRPNERVQVFGRLLRLQPPANPGSYDWTSYHRRNGVEATLICDQRENITRLDPAPPRERPYSIPWIRTRVRGLLVDDVVTGAGEEASLLEAMILGHRSRLDRRLNDIFIRAGCIHFLAVSGVHVAIVMFLVRMVFRFSGAGRVTSLLGMLTAVALYVTIAEPRPPILRAGVIAALYCLARLFGRSSAHINWLSVAALALIAVHPATIFDVGFQLSFAAVLGVVYLSPALRATGAGMWRLVIKRSRSDAMLLDMVGAARFAGKTATIRSTAVSRTAARMGRRIALLFAISLAAWLAGAPIVATHFQRLQPYGALNSLLVFPFVALIMGLGFAKLAVTAISPALGSVLTSLLVWVDSLLIRLVDFLGSLPGATLTCMTPPWWVVLSYYGVLIAAVGLIATDTPLDRENGNSGITRSPPYTAARRVALAIAVASFFTTCLVWFNTGRPTGRLTVTVLSVGAGSATVIELPNGDAVLYDAGSSGSYDVGHSVIVPFLRHRGISRIARIYVSHPNLDHFSGVPAIVTEVECGPVIVNRYFDTLSPPHSPSRHLLDLLDNGGHTLDIHETGDTRWEFGGAVFEMLWPRPPFDIPMTANNSSTVLRISYAGYSVLLPGDVEDVAQRAMIEEGDLRADVLVLPHHGSIRASSKAFFNAVGASIVIRSSGERAAETYSGLESLIGAIPLYNTADVGAVEVVIDENGVRATSLRTGPS